MKDADEVFDPNNPGYLDPPEEPGVAKFSKLICGRDLFAEKDEDAKEAKDETKSGFQTNFLSATLIALCALFKF